LTNPRQLGERDDLGLVLVSAGDSLLAEPQARRRRDADGPRLQPGNPSVGSWTGGCITSIKLSMLELRQVSKVYGSGPTEVRALWGVDLKVEAGELVAVMGPSGSGKTTLLAIAGSLEAPTHGEVFIGGSALSAMGRNRLARLRRRAIGYVFQDFNLLAGLTAIENATLPLELDGVTMRAARKIAGDTLERLGIAELADRYPDDLSGGERQRVAIARAVIGERGLLLADEPTGALDSVNGEAVMRLLRAACGDGVAGVVVTHDAQLASWANRVVFLRDGRAVDQTGAPPGPESLLRSGSER
jgi:putative ABC transport system ATP-binding protein